MRGLAGTGGRRRRRCSVTPRRSGAAPLSPPGAPRRGAQPRPGTRDCCGIPAVRGLFPRWNIPALRPAARTGDGARQRVTVFLKGRFYSDAVRGTAAPERPGHGTCSGETGQRGDTREYWPAVGPPPRAGCPCGPPCGAAAASAAAAGRAHGREGAAAGEPAVGPQDAYFRPWSGLGSFSAHYAPWSGSD